MLEYDMLEYDNDMLEYDMLEYDMLEYDNDMLPTICMREQLCSVSASQHLRPRTADQDRRHDLACSAGDTHACMHACVHTCVLYACPCVCACLCVHTYACAYMHVCVRIRVGTYMRACGHRGPSSTCPYSTCTTAHAPTVYPPTAHAPPTAGPRECCQLYVAWVGTTQAHAAIKHTVNDIVECILDILVKRAIEKLSTILRSRRTCEPITELFVHSNNLLSNCQIGATWTCQPDAEWLSNVQSMR